MCSESTSSPYADHLTGSDSIIRCYCNEKIPIRTAGASTMHSGRQFYSCTKDRRDPARCKFFVWKDELDRAVPTTPPRSSQMRPPPQPTSSQRQKADMTRELSTSSSQKRPRSPSASDLRKANIELALSEGGESSRTVQKPRVPASPVDSLPQFDAWDESEDVYFTACSSPSCRTLALCIEEPPRKKSRTDNDGCEIGSGYMLMTPPMSDGDTMRTGFTSSQPESPTRGIGKATDMSQWETIHADETHPYHQRQSQSSQITVPTSASVSNTTPESIQILLSDMSTALPAYIAKLERKQGAMEKSDSFKRRKIRELEEENASLRNRIRVLEETIAALKTRRPPF